MRKSNGLRPVNKTDGPKKLGKKALKRSRRADNKKVIKEQMMTDDEYCLDCEAVFKDPEWEGHGGNPMEPYEEGFHLCGEKNPRVRKFKDRKFSHE